jgi:MFS family permease
MGFLTIVSSLPTISMKVVGISPVTSTLYLGIAALIWGACFYHWGLLSQKIGRKTILLISGILYLIGVPLYYLYINFGRFWGPIGIFLSILALFIISDTAFPILPAYLTERFVTSVRGSGYGIGYTWGLLIPSFNSFYILWLSRIMPPVYAMTLPLLFLGGILAIIGVLLGPETKDVDFTKTI